MKVNIVTTDNFRREAKKLIKKYRSLKDELKGLSEELESNPRKGALIGEDTYKIRVAVKSKGKGKSGGMRIITYVHFEVKEGDKDETDVFLLSIYDKSEYENISDKLLINLIQEIQSEIDEGKESSSEDDKSEEKNLQDDNSSTGEDGD